MELLVSRVQQRICLAKQWFNDHKMEVNMCQHMIWKNTLESNVCQLIQTRTIVGSQCMDHNEGYCHKRLTQENEGRCIIRRNGSPGERQHNSNWYRMVLEDHILVLVVGNPCKQSVTLYKHISATLMANVDAIYTLLSFISISLTFTVKIKGTVTIYTTTGYGSIRNILCNGSVAIEMHWVTDWQ